MNKKLQVYTSTRTVRGRIAKTIFPANIQSFQEK